MVSIALDAVAEARHAVVAGNVSFALDLRFQYGVLIVGFRSDSPTHWLEAFEAAFPGVEFLFVKRLR
jgi:hypothetical protein